MSARLGRTWRIFGTGLCFALFGIGGALLSFTVFPLLRIAAGSRERAQPLIRMVLRHTFARFVGLMRVLGLLTYEVRGRERLLAGGQLIVANHPTLIDVVFLLSLVPDATCVVKRGLWSNPFLRWPVIWAGYVPNSESDTLLRDCSATLRAGHSLVMFPEGSRSIPDQELRLKRGAAQVALAAGVPVLPVVIACDPLTLTKAEPWYSVPLTRPHWILDVGLPITDAGAADVPPSIAARRLTEHLAQLFSRGVQRSTCDRTASAPNAPAIESL